MKRIYYLRGGCGPNEAQAVRTFGARHSLCSLETVSVDAVSQVTKGGVGWGG